jgi:hypothetical protein
MPSPSLSSHLRQWYASQLEEVARTDVTRARKMARYWVTGYDAGPKREQARGQLLEELENLAVVAAVFDAVATAGKKRTRRSAEEIASSSLRASQ